MIFFFLIKNGLLTTTSIRLLLLHRLCLVRCCIIVLLFSCQCVYMHLCINSEKAFATVCKKIITKCLSSSSLLMHSLSQVQRGDLTFIVQLHQLWSRLFNSAARLISCCSFIFLKVWYLGVVRAYQCFNELATHKLHLQPKLNSNTAVPVLLAHPNMTIIYRKRGEKTPYDLAGLKGYCFSGYLIQIKSQKNQYCLACVSIW